MTHASPESAQYEQFIGDEYLVQFRDQGDARRALAGLLVRGELEVGADGRVGAPSAQQEVPRDEFLRTTPEGQVLASHMEAQRAIKFGLAGAAGHATLLGIKPLTDYAGYLKDNGMPIDVERATRDSEYARTVHATFAGESALTAVVDQLRGTPDARFGTAVSVRRVGPADGKYFADPGWTFAGIRGDGLMHVTRGHGVATENDYVPLDALAHDDSARDGKTQPSRAYGPRHGSGRAEWRPRPGGQ